MRVVLDKNVLVSALLNPSGHPGRILDGFVAEQLFLFYDSRIMAEYAGVLGRAKFGFDEPQLTYVLDLIASQGMPIIPKRLSWGMPDVGDLPFYEVALAAQAYLVTGNKRHFPDEACILTPGEFTTLWLAR